MCPPSRSRKRATEENVEIVGRVLDGFSRLDRASVEPLLHPDVEWRTVLGPLLGVATVSGRDAMLRFAFEEIPDVTENPRVEVEELRELGDGRVLVIATAIWPAAKKPEPEGRA
jgi:ketosteroid isomerase-like protein